MPPKARKFLTRNAYERDMRQVRSLLRPRRQRPRCRSTDEADELASLHARPPLRREHGNNAIQHSDRGWRRFF